MSIIVLVSCTIEMTLQGQGIKLFPRGRQKQIRGGTAELESRDGDGGERARWPCKSVRSCGGASAVTCWPLCCLVRGESMARTPLLGCPTPKTAARETSLSLDKGDDDVAQFLLRYTPEILSDTALRWLAAVASSSRLSYPTTPTQALEACPLRWPLGFHI